MADQIPESEPLPASLPSTYRYRKFHHYLYASIIGVLVGLLALAFQFCLHHAEDSRTILLEHLHEHWPRSGWIVLPVIGVFAGLVVGWLMRFAPEAAGSGIPHLKGVLLGVRHLSWRRLMPVKFIGGVIGIGAGLSMGREGPTVQMSAAIGQVVARIRKVPAMATPQLLSCGAGAGLAAAFNAPLAGFIFVIEELHRELSARTFVGALIAAVVATATAGLFNAQQPSFSVSAVPMLPIWALPLVGVLGVVGGLIGVAFNVGLIRISKFSIQQTYVPKWALPAIVGMMMGLLAWFYPRAVGTGHGPAQELLSGTMSITFIGLMLWLLLKFSSTVVSYGSGAPGGIFAPMLLIGAIMGAAFGNLCTTSLSFLAAHESVVMKPLVHAADVLGGSQKAFAVLGMAAVFVGSVRAPLTGIVLISEMTANYQQLFALCVVCLSAQLVAEWLHAEPIYDALLEEDLHRRGVKPATEASTIYLGVQNDAPLTKLSLREAGLPRGALVVGIERAGRSIVPLAHVRLRPGDHITVSIPEEDPGIALAVAKLCLPDD